MTNLKPQKNIFPSTKTGIVITISLSIALFSIIGSIIFIFSSKSPSYQQADSKQSSDDVSSHNQPSITSVNALGYLEPQGKVIRLSPPETHRRLRELRVNEGDLVKKNQIVAVMDGLEIYQTLVENAEAKVKVAKARLSQMQAGQKAGEIESQRKRIAELEAQLAANLETRKASVARQEIELRKAEADYQRYRSLSGQGVVSEADTESKRLQVEIERERLKETKGNLDEALNVGQEKLKGAQATLTSLTEVRATDILVVQAEVDEALSQLHKAQVDLESIYVRSPISGQILSLNTNIGEIVGSEGIADIGQTQQMYVIAEVYESDLQYVKIGQSAIITSEYGGLTAPIKGVVEQIGLRIDKPQIAIDDPSAQVDVRVAKIKIRLKSEDSDRVKTLNNLQVRASVQVN